MQKPKWITTFLKKTFFIPCSEHQQKKNYYCIDCDLPLCRYCISTNPHNRHSFLQIYKYTYKDSIRIEEMKEHIDCSDIQPYRCNKQKVIVLNPLPSNSSKIDDDDDCCNICHRKLIDAKNYSFCSIACKIEACLREPNNGESLFVARSAKNRKKLKRSGSGRRKGIPQRAPRN